jgi:DNA mismatch repair protein MutL
VKKNFRVLTKLFPSPYTIPMPIRILDPITVTQIAAGEVIDRPASVVKELLENALDAGATEIVVDIENGGKTSILVRDNGSGISKEDLPLAPVKHATSKISVLDDIYSALTFGFRGEALASMAHVGQLEILSKTSSSEVGYKITSFLQDISPLEAVSHPIGTTIVVKDLFKNMPVRHQFLKSESTEAGYIYDVVLHHNLIHPQKTFILKHNGKELYNSSGIKTAKQLLLQMVGKDLKDRLIDVDIEAGSIRVIGVIGNPTLTYPNRAKQWLAVNNRPVKNPTLLKAVQQGFRDLIPANRFPLAVLNIEMGSGQVDVNIHPQKQDIKFLNPGKMIDIIPNVIAAALNGQAPSPPFSSPFSSSSTFSPINRVYIPPTQEYPQPEHTQAFTALFSELPIEPTLPLGLPAIGTLTDGSYFQVLNTYLVIKTPQGLALLDQHAVHERILYEKIKQRAASSGHSQPLMIAEIVDITPDLNLALESSTEVLSQMGFVIEPFGPTQIAIREIPVEFTDTPVQALILRFLELAKEAPGATPDLVLERKETLQMMACKAAIKAGKTMSLAETQHLIRDFLTSPSNYTCPHGRPLCIELGRDQLEKLFLRR